MTEAETRQAKMNGETDVATEGNGLAPPTTDAAELAAVAAERDEYLDLLKRSQADFVNYRRRTEQERGQIRELANQALLGQLLPVLDDLERAVQAVPADQRETPLAEGLQLIARKFGGILERAGVTPFEALGQPFDPAVHEAVEMVPGGGSDTVVAVYQPGYRLGSVLLRPAMVKVGPAEGSGDEDEASAADDTSAAERTKHRRH